MTQDPLSPSKNLEVPLSHTKSVVSLNLRDRFSKVQRGQNNEGLPSPHAMLLAGRLCCVISAWVIECKIPRSQGHMDLLPQSRPQALVSFVSRACT